MIRNFNNKIPKIHSNSFIESTSCIIGDVTIEENVSIWFNAVLRADHNSIYVGKNSNIQDNCTLHIDTNFKVKIGENVTVGHNSILHGCEIGNTTLIGMGSIILNGAKIGENTIVGAGTLVPQGKTFPSGVLLLGSPAKVIRNLNSEEIENIKNSSEGYVKLSKTY
ncbi:transferase, hexapeptide repeat family protein [Clostridium tetani]|uniref:Transferase, hexapeptide repeat family protein n=1 Tax=Clostridium tetani TaxID=1513 RepID=A0ABC8ECM8_CLOTA|nr:gamma carbonic anhydrase family protein [Clostridium tetani]BDR67457.1 transferase, hexapeptide repeat family protein [Clostridium tetani]BDR81389.1 transferase, hexapeptide repeat family protein [Clostridium tetani]BDR89768.1 transferase, hexapeptide repeat family protein [Clostridium tetani]